MSDTLRKAKEHLRIANTLINSCASGVTPFRVSKILNVMAKNVYDSSMILSVILGDEKPQDYDAQVKATPVYMLYEAELAENPTLENSLREVLGDE